MFKIKQKNILLRCEMYVYQSIYNLAVMKNLNKQDCNNEIQLITTV